MQLEYIRPIPSPVVAHEPVLAVEERRGDAPELAELVAHAHAHAPEDTSLACPEPPSPRHDLPRFSGISLGDLVLPIPPNQPMFVAAAASGRDPLSLVAPLASEPRTLLGPGAMTMTLAFMATLVFGVLVVTH